MFIEVECVCLHSATHGITFYDLSYLAEDKHKCSPSGGGERGEKKLMNYWISNYALNK